ncbi:MAG: sulfatase [Balneolales bacterium]
MLKKEAVISIAILLLVSANSIAQNKSEEQKPNFVIIFIDDMGYGDLESYGATGYETPNTSSMAAEGMRFTHFYVPQAVCSASRAALLTGSYSNRVGISGALGPTSPIALNPQEETIADLLKNEGYRTGMMGKWHLGSKEPYLPLQQGFDEYIGIPYSNDMWAVDYDGTPITDTTNTRIRYPTLPLIEGNNKIETIETLEDQSRLTSLFTERAVEFIRKNRNAPFFLYLAHPQPHVPLAVSDRFRGKSKDGLFGDVMMELDWSVGEIMKTLDELGLSEETLVIFTSDNGPWLNYGNHAGNTGGLREGKGSEWEGGVRVPAIMHWEGKISPGTVNNKLASTIDLLPTIVQLSGSDSPSRKIDGVDISSLLFDEEDANPRDHFAYYYGRNELQAIRKDHWKLVFPHSYRSYKQDLPGRDGWPGQTTTAEADYALYNLRTDPGETLDVRDGFPEVVRELEALAENYREALGDALTGREGAEKRPPAQVDGLNSR